MNIHRLLTFHAVITLAAGMVLIFAPGFIPATVNIELQRDQFLLCYLLAAAELALAYLSFYGSRSEDRKILRLITVTIMIFHSATLLLELFSLGIGADPKLIGNIIARLAIIALFYYYGVLRLSKSIGDKPNSLKNESR